VEQYSINWNIVKANVPGNPHFVFQNSGGFSHSQSQGAYSWVMINTSNANDWEQNYLSNFYLTSFSFGPSSTFATKYKGFNQKYAARTQHRVVNQNCGETNPRAYSGADQGDWRDGAIAGQQQHDNLASAPSGQRACSVGQCGDPHLRGQRRCVHGERERSEHGRHHEQRESLRRGAIVG
jgi:hypothetical protein